ncbi:MAG: alcohol dehydrogenase catalytic domain-containing protein [Planctomycetes bacterium]|nr:alcohol dehydrogenase catalytic domain-containing protein [Planctomycetota bacterium]
MSELPDTEYAIQLVGPGKLRLNKEKPVPKPGPHQIVAKVEAVGLCFSDLKLLNQFTEHVRKSKIVSGIDPEALKDIPSYVPGEKPTVPGHEVVCRIVAVGPDVKHHKLGERCLVQADYRQVRTAGANAAFGYNIEGGLQEYVLMDERIIVNPENGERYMITVDDDLCASAVCLVEPWACVEDSYVSVERQTIKPGGKLLIVADAGHTIEGVVDGFAADGAPESVTAICADSGQLECIKSLGLSLSEATDAAGLPDEEFDDIIYFGAMKKTIEILNDKLAACGLMNIVLCGKKIGGPVSVGVGRIHYGLTRWIGTTGANAAESYKTVPHTGEVRPGEKIMIVGAGGPMGQMHVIRDVCTGIDGVSVTATDLDDERLDALSKKAQPLAEANGVAYRTVNTKTEKLDEKFTYIGLMAPVGALVSMAIGMSAEGTLINIFAGIPAPTKHDLDLDRYIEQKCYMFGTSGSTMEDLRIVLRKVTAGDLDTNRSVDAVSGMAGAADGMAAVENRTLAGKIIVYPALHDVGLIPLHDMHDHYPTVAAKLDNGQWTKAAETELLAVAKG